MKFVRKWRELPRDWLWFAALLGLFLAVVSVIASVRSRDGERTVEAGPLVATEPVMLAEGYAVEVRNIGRAEAARRSALGFELPGAIAAVAVDVGDAVEAGQPLAHLDTRRLAAARDEAAALVRAAQANLVQAEAELRRVARLAELAVASTREVDEAVGVRDAAAASRDAGAAALARIETDLAKSSLPAPYAGTVVARLRYEGEIVAAGEPIVEIIETSRMRVRAGVPPVTARDWRPGMTVVGERDGERFDAVIERVVPARDASTRTWEVLVTIDADHASDGDLVTILSERRVATAGFWVPRLALAESARGLWGCYVLVDDAGPKRVALRPVEVVHHKGERAYVRGALRDGERIVTSGAHKLAPDIRVSLDLVAEVSR